MCVKANINLEYSFFINYNNYFAINDISSNNCSCVLYDFVMQ